MPSNDVVAHTISLPLRGIRGRPLCRWCSRELPQGARVYCSEECMRQYRLATDWDYLCETVFSRDNGKCSVCGLSLKDFANKPGQTDVVDYVVPLHAGGRAIPGNLHVICQSCRRLRSKFYRIEREARLALSREKLHAALHSS